MGTVRNGTCERNEGRNDTRVRKEEYKGKEGWIQEKGRKDKRERTARHKGKEGRLQGIGRKVTRERK